MRTDLSRIIASLISDVSGKTLTEPICEGLNILKEKWPGLTATEKEEIAAIVLSLKTIEEEYTKHF